MDPTYPLLPVLCFVGGFLALIPLPWLLSRWSVGACMYAFWISLGCFTRGINLIIWKDNVNIVATLWCDIAIRIYIGKGIGITAASLTITRRIYQMLSLRGSLVKTYREKWNSAFFDLSLTLGLPIAHSLCYFVVQGHRFNIYEESGCDPTIVNTWPAFFLSHLWPLAISLFSMSYSVSIIQLYLKRRKTLKDFASAPDFSQYYRVLALGCIDAFVTVPCSVFILYLNYSQAPILPWTGWEDIHYDFWRIMVIPSEIWQAKGHLVVRQYWNSLASPICAIIFFIFFGLTREVRCGYLEALKHAGRWLGLDRSIDAPNSRRETTLVPLEFRAASNHPASYIGSHELDRISLAETFTSSTFEMNSIGNQQANNEITRLSGQVDSSLEPMGKCQDGAE